MTNPISLANAVQITRMQRSVSYTPEDASADRYWSSLRKRVQAGASLRNVRPRNIGNR